METLKTGPIEIRFLGLKEEIKSKIRKSPELIRQLSESNEVPESKIRAWIENSAGTPISTEGNVKEIALFLGINKSEVLDT